ncbi:mitochondrial inner membrane protein Mitofilin [Cristinia sonorae]|uniref:MICOS complex subunit MIC60 n=1 Tax=Cristinia sonorae TaxID=1940300 RepID=A0A8K0UQ30_9AGAR|nr:mitochondrial inner membrane protein Mitofilin [Cristinia sonorae]
MFRAVSTAKAVRASSGRSVLRATRRYTTEPPAQLPKKKKRYVRRFVLYTSAATATFYTGSAFLAFKNPQYYDFFIEKVPLGNTFLQYAEDNNWDTLTPQKALQNAQDGVAYVQRLFNREKAAEEAQKAKAELDKAKAKAAAANMYQGAKERVKSVASSVKTTVDRTESAVSDKSAQAMAIAKHQAEGFSEGVEDLVRKAEAAIGKEKSKPAQPDATTTPTQPDVAPDSVPPHDNETQEASVKDVAAPSAGNVYDAPLPVGFEPPPGYKRPTPPKPKPAPVEEKPAPAPLPLVAPAVQEFAASEPVISQLASVIDNLASYLNTNPAAAEKAHDILDVAKSDLTQLAKRIDEVKEEERTKLEATLDEQTREYSLRLMELEMAAQDKLDSQEEDFRKVFEEEKAKFVAAYREKLNKELETQSEIINERLKEEVIAQGIELQRRWIRDIKVRVEQERGDRLAKLDELATGLKRLERVALDNSAFLDENLRIHALWSAFRALNHAVDASERKPFRDELRVLRHITAAREDPVVSTVLDTLESSDVPDIGVEPFADLASWFTTSVAPRVSSVALVPDQNAGVLSHLASHLLSSFSFKRQGLVPGSDVLSTLARAEYYMNEKDLDSATRELNQLTGTAKVLLTDWLEAARKRLEVLQALEVIQAQATLASLLVAQD